MSAWEEHEIEAEAVRLMSVGDSQGAVALLDSRVKYGEHVFPVSCACKYTLLRAAMKFASDSGAGFPEQFCRALLEYTSPEGYKFSFRKLALEEKYSMVWGIGEWALNAWDLRLVGSQAFAHAWITEQTSWSPPRSTWLAAVVWK